MLAAMNMILLVFAAVMLGSCGIGTEIGNGLKPKDESPKGDPSNDPQSKGETTSSQNSPTPTTNTTTTTTTSTTEGASSNYDTEVLFAECGSPFSVVMISPLQLEEMHAGLATGRKLHAVYLGESSVWRISKDGKVLYHVNRRDNTKVELADAEKRIVTSGYACESTVQRKEQNLNDGQKIVTQSVILLKNSRKITLSWSFLYEKNAVNPRLQKIDISSDAGIPVTYEVKILNSDGTVP